MSAVLLTWVALSEYHADRIRFECTLYERPCVQPTQRLPGSAMAYGHWAFPRRRTSTQHAGAVPVWYCPTHFSTALSNSHTIEIAGVLVRGARFVCREAIMNRQDAQADPPYLRIV